MFGPAIITRSIERHRLRDGYGNLWQYNPWSDHHSKVACWAALFDLLLACDLLKQHAQAGTVAFGINHQMADFRMDRPKDLDLVLCTPGTRTNSAELRTFASLIDRYGIVLTGGEQEFLNELPALFEAPVGSVHVALEAKATMTAHVKALPRLYDELTSSHSCIHGNSNRAIAVGLSVINAADEFVSPKNNLRRIGKRAAVVNPHQQPKDTIRTIEKVKQIARRTNVDERGFDALAIVVINMRNDGSGVKLITDSPAPPPGDIFHYDSMIRRVAQLYEARFPHA